MFNLKKHAADPKLYEKLLIDNNEGHGISEVKNPGNYDWLLQKNHKNKDNTVHYQKQLESTRTGEGKKATIDRKLDDDKKVYNLRRTDKAFANPIPHVNFVQEAWDQKMYEAHRTAEDPDRDTMFWDKFVGSDVKDSQKHKIPNNKQKSQLQNHPDRFKGLDKTMPINESYQKDQSTWTKEDKVYKMVTASLKDADAMLFQLFAKAKVEDREVTDNEQQMVTDINAAKTRILGFLNGDIKQRFIVAEKKGGADIYTVYERFFEKNKEDLKLKESQLEVFTDIKEAKKAYPNAIGIPMKAA